MNQQYTILGFSPAVVAMVIEILKSQFDDDFEITIISNIETSIIPDFEFRFPNIKVEIIESMDWVHNNAQPYVMGVNKCNTKHTVFQYFLDQYDLSLKHYQTIFHQNTSVSSTVNLKNGVVINPGVIIAPFASIGELVTINRNASIGHHSVIEAFSTIHPGVNIAGHCKIGSSVTIGMGANVIDGITIGNNSIIGAGSLVTKDLPANVIAYGSPAIVKSTIEN